MNQSMNAFIFMSLGVIGNLFGRVDAKHHNALYIGNWNGVITLRVRKHYLAELLDHIQFSFWLSKVKC